MTLEGGAYQLGGRSMGDTPPAALWGAAAVLARAAFARAAGPLARVLDRLGHPVWG